VRARPVDLLQRVALSEGEHALVLIQIVDVHVAQGIASLRDPLRPDSRLLMLHGCTLVFFCALTQARFAAQVISANVVASLSRARS
jgi:hypothetical protein